MTEDEKRDYYRIYRVANKTRLAAQRAARRNALECSIPDCAAPYFGNGYCACHYNRVRRHGDPTKILRRNTRGKAIAERLAFYTQRTDDCWKWIGPQSGAGYGRLRVGKNWQLAHRAAYEFEHGEEIPPGMWVLHHCDNRMCVRPDHLFLGVAADNTADMMAKGRDKGPTARLSEQAVTAIRVSLEKGVALARQYDVTPGTISNIRTRRTWKHVP